MKKTKEMIKRILKLIKIRHLIILIILLIFNTYAWFLYATEVSTSITAHVTSWNVDFTNEDGESVTEIIIDVSRIFPGMQTYEKTIEVVNKGQSDAKLDYEIQHIEILGDVFEEGTDYTSEELEKKLLDDYPFKISVSKSTDLLIGGSENESFTIRVRWPYESGNDALDTYWGRKAYDYYAQNPDGKGVYLKILLKATQV